MVRGGDVQGGRVYGPYSELTLGNDLDIGSGIFVPTLPTNALYGSLGRWLGLDGAHLDQVLPNLSQFPSSQRGIDLMCSA